MLQKNHEWEHNSVLLIQSKQQEPNRKRIDKKLEHRGSVVMTDCIHEDKWTTFKKNSIYPRVREEVVAVLNNVSEFTKMRTMVKSNIPRASPRLNDMPKWWEKFSAEMFVFCGKKK